MYDCFKEMFQIVRTYKHNMDMFWKSKPIVNSEGIQFQNKEIVHSSSNFNFFLEFCQPPILVLQVDIKHVSMRERVGEELNFVIFQTSLASCMNLQHVTSKQNQCFPSSCVDVHLAIAITKQSSKTLLVGHINFQYCKNSKRNLLFACAFFGCLSCSCDHTH